MGVSAAVTMDTGIFIFCACADAHMHSIKWAVVYRPVYSVIRHGLEERCPDNLGSTVALTTRDSYHSCVLWVQWLLFLCIRTLYS